MGITYRLSRTGKWSNTHNARPWQCGVISSSPAPSKLFIKNFSAHSGFCWYPFQIHVFQEWNESVLPLTNIKHHQQLSLPFTLIEHYEVPPETGPTKAFTGCKVYRIRQQNLKARFKFQLVMQGALPQPWPRWRQAYKSQARGPCFPSSLDCSIPKPPSSPSHLQRHIHSPRNSAQKKLAIPIWTVFQHSSSTAIPPTPPSTLSSPRVLVKPSLQCNCGQVRWWKIGEPNPKPDHCQHKPDCLNPNVHKL